MVDKPFTVDSKEDVLYLSLGIIAILAFTFYGSLDAQLRAVYREKTGYFSTPEAELTFTEEQINNINWGSQTSLGVDPVGDERLYCLVVDEGVVSNVRPVDDIRESQYGSISGACYDIYGSVDGFVHTQPEGISSLSEEDKDLEGDIDYTCIQFDEIVKSPTGVVSGLNCWMPENGDFRPIEVEIRDE